MPVCHRQIRQVSAEYFVSILGSDSWDGTSQEHIDVTDIGPWKTVQHALNKLRQARPNPPTSDDHVTLIHLPGIHFLSAELYMDGRDSHLTTNL